MRDVGLKVEEFEEEADDNVVDIVLNDAAVEKLLSAPDILFLVITVRIC